MNRPLYMAALRVLGQLSSGGDYSAEDLTLLRRHARTSEMPLPVEDLCCEIILRELGKSKRPLRPVPPGPGI